jgi:integrase
MRKRYPHLHKRGHRYYFCGYDNQHKRFEESLRTRDIEIAHERYLKRMQEINEGRAPTDLGRQTLQAAVKNWLEYQGVRVANSTLKAERSITRNLIRVLGKDVSLQALADAQKIHYYQNTRRKSGIVAKTVNNEIQVLAGILRLAQLWHRVEPHYKPLKVNRSDVPDALPSEEIKRLLEAAKEYGRYSVAPYAAVLAFSTGMRSGEIKKLQLGAIHAEEEHPYLQVRRATTKTDQGARRVVLDRVAVWAIRKLIARANLLGALNPDDYLLLTERARHTRLADPLHGGSGYDSQHPQTSWEAEWQKFRESVGISHRRFHDLRHTYISRAAEAGIAVAVVQAQVGHVSAQMVAWYTHISDRAQHKAAKQIENNSPELFGFLGLPVSLEQAAGSQHRTRNAKLPVQGIEQHIDSCDSEVPSQVQDPLLLGYR